MKAKRWFRIHSFTGVITGLLLFVICWSGTFAVFSQELDWLVRPDLRVTPGENVQSWGRLLETAQQARPDSRVVALYAPLYRRAAAGALMRSPENVFDWLYIDPYSAELAGQHSGYTLQRFFRNFHRRLLFPQPWGLYLVSFFALTLLVSTLAALFFYRRWWRGFFRFRASSRRAVWSELHRLAGLWSLWFIVVMLVTSLWYLFEGVRSYHGDGISGYAGTGERAVYRIPEPKLQPDGDTLSVDELVARARQLRPDLEIKSLSLALSHPGLLYLDGQAGHLLVRNRANQLHLNRQTGEAVYNQTAADYPLYWRWSDTADPLHFGDFAGLWSKSIWFVFGLLLSGLILTGTWLHARRLALGPDGRARHRWPGTAAALAVSLLVLAASIPVGLLEAYLLFGPEVNGERQLPNLAPGVKAVMIGWIGLTLSIIAAWVWLLWQPLAARRQATTDRSRAKRSP